MHMFTWLGARLPKGEPQPLPFTTPTLLVSSGLFSRCCIREAPPQNLEKHLLTALAATRHLLWFLHCNCDQHQRNSAVFDPIQRTAIDSSQILCSVCVRMYVCESIYRLTSSICQDQRQNPFTCPSTEFISLLSTCVIFCFDSQEWKNPMPRLWQRDVPSPGSSADQDAMSLCPCSALSSAPGALGLRGTQWCSRPGG